MVYKIHNLAVLYLGPGTIMSGTAEVSKLYIYQARWLLSHQNNLKVWTYENAIISNEEMEFRSTFLILNSKNQKLLTEKLQLKLKNKLAYFFHGTPFLLEKDKWQENYDKHIFKKWE